MSLVPHRNGSRPQHVTAALDLRLVAPEGETVLLPVVLRYDRSDPWAVTVAFGHDDGAGAEVQWVFARDLLLDGLHAPAGQGDVRIWPSAGQAVATTCIALSSPDGRALLEAGSDELRAFAAQTLALVERGDESLCFDLDAEIGLLLTA